MLNTFAICGAGIGPAVSEQLGKGLVDLQLTEHQVKVFIALDWEPLREQAALKTLTLPIGLGLDFSTAASPGVNTLATLLADKCAPLLPTPLMPSMSVSHSP